MRRLLVMRHAKAEQYAASDRERELTPQGVRDAAEAGAWVRERGVLPDHAFVSSASRTRGTWAAFAEAAGLELEPGLEDSLYSAGPEGALAVLRTAPARAETVLVIGHNPTMAYLVHLLDDGKADPGAFSRVSEGYPTAALTVLEVAGEWADLDMATARIADFHVGRG